jgi:hypothetical protein
VLEPNLLRLAMRAKPDRTAPLLSHMFAGAVSPGPQDVRGWPCSGLAASDSRTRPQSSTSPRPHPLQRRAVTRTATHAATPRAAWQRRCSENGGQTIHPLHQPFSRQTAPVHHGIVGVIKVGRGRAAVNSWRAGTGALCGYAPSPSKHGDAPSFRAATRVVSDRTAPQHRSTSAGLFQSHGFQTLGYRPAEFLRRQKN